MITRGATIRSLGLLVGFALLALPACGDDDGTAADTTTTAEASSTTTTTGAEVEVRAYFLRDEALGPVARVAADGAVAEGAMEGLLAGPEVAESEVGFATAIPMGTELRSVTIDDTVATVDLTEEFTSGGGSASMMGRVAQVVFTLTQVPTVEAVAFEVEGTPLTELGGEGLLLEEPQTRADWESLSPAILVESPLPFADVTSPLRVTGTANTFEAMFWVTITDGEGEIVYDEPAQATSGTGTRGTFTITADFEVPRSGVGEVIVFEKSAKDGSPTNLVEIPVDIS